MSFPLPLLCGADPYLTRAHLQELFDQYMSASHPTAALFSALVSNVRQPYLIELMAAKDALLAQQMDHARQISDVQATYERTRAAGPVGCGHSNTVTPTKVPSTPACDGVFGTMAKDGTGGAGGDGETGQTLPTFEKVHELLHESSILYVSRNRSENRDWVSWANDGISPVWKEHLQLNVFKSKQPGTVRIGVAGNRSGARIKCVVGPDDPDEPWAIWFWAYPRPAPGTRMISIVIYDNRGFIFGSEREVEEDDWQSVFYLWFPV